MSDKTPMTTTPSASERASIKVRRTAAEEATAVAAATADAAAAAVATATAANAAAAAAVATANAAAAAAVTATATADADVPAAPSARRVFNPSAPAPAAPEAAFAAAVADAADPEDFAALFEGQLVRDIRRVSVGEMVDGNVVEIGTEYVFIDIGAKTEAYMPRTELQDDDGHLTVSVGDKLRATVMALEKGGQILVGRRLQKGQGSVEAIEMAFNNELPVEGRVIAVNKGGFDVEVMGQRAFCPLSQIEIGRTETPEIHINQTYEFQITEYGSRGRRFVVSRVALLKATQMARAEMTRAQIKVGAQLEGMVRSIQPYGVFVDLGGVDGFVHISELSYSHVKNPSEVVSEGQVVQVEVLGIEQGPKGERVSLSIRSTTLDPWREAAQWLKIGELYSARVARLAPFGAFVELQAGVDGLLSISELSWEKRINHPSEVLSEGDQVEVAVIGLDLENKRISLSLRATQGNPWEGAAERFPEGGAFDGEVERVVDFGVFVRLEPGLIGLIPLSELGLAPGQSASAAFQPGDSVGVEVLTVDEERRRISLRKAGAAKRADGAKGAPSDNKKPQGRPAPGKGKARSAPAPREGGLPSSYREVGSSFATFGDLLKKKLSSQEPDKQ